MFVDSTTGLKEGFYLRGAGGAPLSNADLNFSGNAIEARGLQIINSLEETCSARSMPIC